MIEVLFGLTIVLLVIVGARRLKQSIHTSSLSLPPGPAPIPFLGNIIGVDTSAPHLTYTAWSKTYGDIVYTRALGQDIIILNSEQVATALLEKRSNKYSSRPSFSVAELFGWEWAATIAQYGPRFKLHRRLFHQVFHAKAALTYRPKQVHNAYQMLTQILNDSAHYHESITMFSASIVMAVTYGYDTNAERETFVASMQRAADIFLRFCTPEISAVYTAFPFLIKVLSPWFPGMGFKSEAAECRRLAYEALHEPYAWVKRRLEKGTATSSMVADAITRYHLEDDSKDPELVEAIKHSAGTLYGAAVETTNSTLLIFIYPMMNYPEVQRRAQAEIDRVVGRQRLPNFEDRASLPYVDALLREIMRWQPVTPIGVPHATTEDDVYQGYYIPRDAIIIPNLWAIAHNEDKYPNPDAFIPERFLRDDGTLNSDNVPWIFGFGRRICPGRHVAGASLWCAIVCMLAVFRIEKTKGSENVEWTKGTTIHPLPFPCKFVTRDKNMDAEKLASLIYASRVEL